MTMYEKIILAFLLCELICILGCFIYVRHGRVSSLDRSFEAAEKRKDKNES